MISMANIVGWALASLLVGWVAAWLVRGWLANDGLATAQADARAKQEQLKRELEARVGRSENDLHGAKETIQMRDNAIAERDFLIRQQTDQLASGLSRLAAATAERDDRQAVLEKQGAALASLEQTMQTSRVENATLEQRAAEAAARVAQLEPLGPKLAAFEAEFRETKSRLESAQVRINSQDVEMSNLHKRNVELEPLTVQAKDRQSRLLALENRLAEAVRVRDAEIAHLKKRCAEFEALPRRLEEVETKRAQLSAELSALRRAKDVEIESLQLELRAIAALQRRLAQRDEHFLNTRELEIEAQRKHDWDRAVLKAELAQRDFALDRKDAAIGRMHQQLAELAPLPEALANHSLRALELERGVAQREEKLRAVVADVANLRARLQSPE
jgi:tetrahydromethanopterin S-methyltransferase subunit G